MAASSINRWEMGTASSTSGDDCARVVVEVLGHHETSFAFSTLPPGLLRLQQPAGN